MKKVLITIAAVLTLMSCSTEEQAQTQENNYSTEEVYLQGDYEWWNSPYSSMDSNCDTSFINLEAERQTSEIRYTQDCVEYASDGDWSIAQNSSDIYINGIAYRITDLSDNNVHIAWLEIVNESNGSVSRLTRI
tara:strand:+ start:818 stop:1219 length:402 start_codon:yes stop_codon:yes gene_type:complete